MLNKGQVSSGNEFDPNPAAYPIFSVSRHGGELSIENAANRTPLLPRISLVGKLWLAWRRICDRSSERQREGKALLQRRIYEITQNLQLSCIHTICPSGASAAFLPIDETMHTPLVGQFR